MTASFQEFKDRAAEWWPDAFVAEGDNVFALASDGFALRFAALPGSHMAHLAALKDAIDLADDGHAGMGLVPFAQDLNADEIGGPDILDDLVAIASH